MRTIDLSPLYRSFIGSDHLAALVDAAARNEKQASYPPYNIELLGEDKYRITMAVAGFAQDNIEITVQENTLVVSGKNDAPKDEAERKFLHKGISERSFERKFQLGDNVKVLAADMEHGLLHIDLERIIPEAEKPRKIEIGSRLIEN
jgi:molecular chaperone IbpA